DWGLGIGDSRTGTGTGTVSSCTEQLAIKRSDERGCLPMKKIAAFFVGGASAPTGFPGKARRG
ncbi:hypothetical protein, partial [Xanthomonas sp. LMG 8992]|uniref:hypothetical protein n=1 Tax=Xanthomonas sp. LMG 8992 TaxID=1591157 RepID=UPI001F23C517